MTPKLDDRSDRNRNTRIGTTTPVRSRNALSLRNAARDVLWFLFLKGRLETPEQKKHRISHRPNQSEGWRNFWFPGGVSVVV
jgi:hypothetical protein